MSSIALHVRQIKKLPGGDYTVQVSLVNLQHAGPETSADDALLESISLPVGTKHVERLENPAFVEQGAAIWFKSRGGKWDKENVRKYLQQILKQ